MNRKITVSFSILVLAIIVSLVSSVFNTSCGTGTKTSSTTSAAGVSFSRDIQPIFNGSCVVCHQGAGQAGLTLEPNLSYGKLVGVPSTESATELRVKAGAPDQSYLIAKLTGSQVQAGGIGAQMPLNAAPLSQAQIDKIRQWISAGAPNN
jgi:cytochrome c553